MIRRTIAAALLAAVAMAGGAQAAEHDGSVVRSWNELAFDAVRAGNLSDARAARLYAMVDAAMYDAVNATAGGAPREAAIVPARRSAAGDPRAAAAAAAHDVLAATFPALVAEYDTQLAEDLAAASSAQQAQRGRQYGAEVASAVLAARSGDGSTPEDVQPGDPSIGTFEQAWPGAQFRFLEPFAIADAGAYVSDGPPPLTSPEYAAAFDEVKALGAASPADPAKRATYDFWALGGRTNQPPGAWLQVAATVSAGQDLSLTATARLFALESMALADTVAPTYATKYAFHSWRPRRAIREAEFDGNPLTEAEPGWSPRGGTAGSSPEYTSGHSSFSSAGAAVLAGFFCNDSLSFSLHTDPTNGIETGTRSYGSFSQAAAEAGLSRVVGGLHFPFSNEDGAVAGRAVAAEVLANALLREHGHTHDGSCPR